MLNKAVETFHLDRYEALKRLTPNLIRYHLLNDGNDTLVFRAQDVCEAIGALDYAMAMQCVAPDDIVVFSHPDTDAKGMRYACVTRRGVDALIASVHDAYGDWPGYSRAVLEWIDQIEGLEAA